MAVNVEYKKASGFLFVILISKFLNLEIIAMRSSSYCPLNDLNAVSKAFIKTYLLTAVLIVASLGNYFVSLPYYPFGVYLILLNCVVVAGIRVLHVKGDIKCFNWWQVIVAVFFFTWITEADLGLLQHPRWSAL